MSDDLVRRVIRVHLKSGGYVDSADATDPTVTPTDEAVEQVRNLMMEMTKSPPGDGWQMEMDMPNGGWATFPGSSVDYVELVGFGGHA